MTLARRPSRPVLMSASAAALAAASAASSGLRTRNLTMRLSMRVFMSSEFSVIAFFQGVEQVGGAVLLAVVLDLLIAAHFHLRAILEREHVGGALQVRFLDQHALEGLRIEAERSAALEPLFVRVQVD